MPRTAAEIAKQRKRKGYNLYLNAFNMDHLQKQADKGGASLSQVVDEAIAFYIEAMKDKKTD